MSKQIEVPKAKQIERKFVEHGSTRTDSYFWLRDRNDPDVRNHLEAENRYTEASMEDTAPLQARLFEEIKGRIKETDSTEPARRGSYWYYSRTEEGKPYRIHCRKKDERGAVEEILLDGNQMSEGHPFFSLGALEISPDQNWMAYSVDFTGSEVFQIQIKNLLTGEVVSDQIPEASYGLEWSNDNSHLYYTTRDKAERPYKIFRHQLHTSSSLDEMLFEEKDEAFHLALGKMLDRTFVVVVSESSTTTEVRLIAANDSKAEPRIFIPRKSGVEYSIDHSGKFFYVRTNEGAKNFKVMRVPDSNMDRAGWVEFIPHRISSTLTDISCFKNWLVISKREDGLKKLTIIDLRTMGMHDIAFPEPAYDLSEATNLEFDSSYFRIQYSSLVTPKTIFDYDLENRRLIEKKKEVVLGAFNSSDYVTNRLWVLAKDNVRIPVSIVYRKDFQKDGSRPLLLEGYGAYGISNDVDFSSKRLSLLDRGFAYAVAHIRGGGEMGETWHDDGKMQHKKNTFTDFISVAEYLIAEKFTSAEKLVIAGGSAGGLLMGAVTNMRPDLFKAVVAKVPFVDLLNTMSDSSLPLTVGEYEEWGNPAKEEDYLYMRSYSPYDNVEAKAYPNILALTSLNDTRVAYWEPAKWVAKLRELKTDQNRLLLKINMEAGHGGAADRYKGIHDLAFEYAFLFRVLGVTD